MILRKLLSAIGLTVALASAASAQEPTRPETSLHRLRNVAAVDAAKAMNQFAEENKLPVAAIAELVSNSVVVAGDPAACKQLVAMLERLDKLPPQVLLEVVVMRVPAGFAEQIGLADREKSEAVWYLTARELRMLAPIIRQAKKDGELDILSRPQLIAGDNMTENYQLVGNVGEGISARVTPRVLPDGFLVRIATQIESANEMRSRETIVKVAEGGSIALRVGKAGEKGESEILLIATAHQIVK